MIMATRLVTSPAGQVVINVSQSSRMYSSTHYSFVIFHSGAMLHLAKAHGQLCQACPNCSQAESLSPSASIRHSFLADQAAATFWSTGMTLTVMQ